MTQRRLSSAPSLSTSFVNATQPEVAQRIAGVAAGNQYTVIADMDHRTPSAYRVIAHDGALAALSSAGVRHIAVEALDPGQNQIIAAYMRGEVSDRALRHNYTELSVSNLQGDFGANDSHLKTALVDLIQGARRHGITVHGVNGYEGLAPPEIALPIMERAGQTRLNLMRAMDAAPGYFDMPRAQQTAFIRQNLVDQGIPPNQMGLYLTDMGLLPQQRAPVMVGNATGDEMIARMEGDSAVASRILNVTRGERSVVIYGGGHAVRSHGDIDNLLPNSATIEVYDDRRAYMANVMPAVRRSMESLGLDVEDRVGRPGSRNNFSLDLRTRTWSDDTGGSIRLLPIPVPPDRPLELGRPEVAVPLPSRPDQERQNGPVPAPPDRSIDLRP